MLVLISLDGMSPDFYLDPSRRAPTLKALARAGMHARRLQPVYPTVTFTNHVTLVTGVRSDQHGVYGNTRFCESDPLEESWVLEARAMRAPTLWDVAESQGLRCALIRWPVTVGARASWVIPEVFDWSQTSHHMEPELLRELKENTAIPSGGGHGEFDRWSTEVTRHLIRNKRPDLILLHLVMLDHVQHEHGPRAPEVERELEVADARIGQILEEMDLSRDQLMVVGDHGFIEFTARINLNGLFRRLGWLKAEGGCITEWTVAAHQNCGQAAVYCRDAKLEPEVLRVLRENAPGLFRVVDRASLDQLGAFPEALCAVDCLPGFSIGQDVSGESLVTRLASTRGEHGHLPDVEGIPGGWLAAGYGIKAGSVVGEMRMEEVAGIAAAWLGIPFGTRLAS